MRKHVLVVCAALLAALFVPASVHAVQITKTVTTPVGDHFDSQRVTLDVAPPDSDDDGCANADDAYDGPGCEPPPPPEAPPPAAPGYSAAGTASTGGSGCVGMEAESGSAGYDAMSPTGYIGCYQISPDHFTGSGSCAGLGTDPAGQDACAGIICATEGAGAWTNPEGANPCGYLGGA